jgi:hypothetical protein
MKRKTNRILEGVFVLFSFLFLAIIRNFFLLCASVQLRGLCWCSSGIICNHVTHFVNVRENVLIGNNGSKEEECTRPVFIRKQNGDRETIYYRYNKTKLSSWNLFSACVNFSIFSLCFHASYVGTQTLAGVYNYDWGSIFHASKMIMDWMDSSLYSQNRYGHTKTNKTKSTKQ